MLPTHCTLRAPAVLALVLGVSAGMAQAGSPTPAPEWRLETADTRLTLTVARDRPAITRLQDTDPKVGWNWAPSETVLPLLNTVYVNGRRYAPSWTFQGAKEDSSNGTSVTLTFHSTAAIDGIPGNGLSLTQTWWAAKGPGPVEEMVSITNNTGSELTLNDSDVIAADATFHADDTVTLWRFGRESVNVPADPGFNTGVFQTTMLKDLNKASAVRSTISNDSTAGPYVLPFVILDVAGIHGLYIGYEFDFGRFSQETYGSTSVVRSTFYLWDSGSVTEPAGGVFKFPGMFFGTYAGDTDAGSNRMKEWFWNNKITPTIRDTPAEPLVEMNIETYLGPTTVESNTESGCKAWFASHPIASWGVELAKLDSGWTDDEFSPDPRWDWNPNPKTWPDGMVAPAIAHQNRVLLSLYLVNRYDRADLATPEGVSEEEKALLSRYDEWKYDYWRTDGDFESTADYLSHEGFLQVLDFMIETRPPGYGGRPGFRWENCSAGGSKKSFDLLERQSVMTLEDSGAWFPSKSGLNYLKAYYANSYMICPVQMKDDNIDIPNYPPNPATLDTIPWEKYTYRTGFLGAWMDGWGGQVYPEHVALYKKFQRPILRGADVYHLAGFPFPDGSHWDGFEFFNRALNKGSVILLKPLCSLGNSPTIYLKGLDPVATYTLTFQDRATLNSSYAHVQGSGLMAGGSGIAAISGRANDYDSEIIWINR